MTDLLTRLKRIEELTFNCTNFSEWKVIKLLGDINTETKAALFELHSCTLEAEPVNMDANYWKTRYMLLKAKTEPGSVSLNKCVQAYLTHLHRRDAGHYSELDTVKAVLDAAGVAYVD